MKKILIRNCTFVIVLMILVVPVLSLAAGLVPDCSIDPVTKQCVWGWGEFMTLVNNFIHFILFDLVVPIAAIMFFYAGFELVTSGGSTEKRGKAKNIFTNAVIGLVISVAAWLIIRTILSILGYDGVWIFKGF